MQNPKPLVVSLSNHAREARVLRQAQDERTLGNFSARAARLAGLAARWLGWRPDEFWNATPAELAAIFAADEPAAGAPLTRPELTALVEQDRHG